MSNDVNTYLEELKRKLSHITNQIEATEKDIFKVQAKFELDKDKAYKAASANIDPDSATGMGLKLSKTKAKQVDSNMIVAELNDMFLLN